MKKGNVYLNKMGSVLKVTQIKGDFVSVTYNGKRKSPVEKSIFENLINNGTIKEV